MESGDMRVRVKKLFDYQRFAVLATQGGTSPYTSLMTFAVTEDLKHIILVTDQSTRKFENLLKNPNVALLVDNRSNEEADITEAIAVTALGTAKAEDKEAKENLLEIYQAKHPALEAFARYPSQVLLDITVTSYLVVSGFQDIYEFSP
ncbi:MAG: pyridoxamine 5'-phosphate oxidase family protein [Syntrophales bacterium]|nr:pyridoxamine 5'-phosphate oxidase family protein [Syntrophales bacterium]MDY0043871.1 pyridoxamine 5'-phosphate oxidase family protein [Syntrophales bacterium]